MPKLDDEQKEACNKSTAEADILKSIRNSSSINIFKIGVNERSRFVDYKSPVDISRTKHFLYRH